ncbi:hypothetical protein N7535_006283 [Penicillium sp. DV-2018c]|nr:hypothetical protein N7461_007639 [Penicillium sp. DV-2018c]KAJ5566977.1 hypothetical protein N7535_006283 [Penicillium sp. DV-2018c]
MRHESGRFARHPRFRFVVFNMPVRRSAMSRVDFFVKNRNDRDISADELRAAFESDAPEARKLAQDITRHFTPFVALSPTRIPATPT